jgi:hypothetical protein
LITSIVHLRALESIEINGSTSIPGAWDESILFSLPPLKSISLILPDRAITSLLPELIKRQSQTLEQFSIISQGATYLGDALFAEILDHLSPSHSNELLSSKSRSTLKTLSVVGCPKLTDVYILRALKDGALGESLMHLALESVGISTDFWKKLVDAHLGKNLRLVKLTHPGKFGQLSNASELRWNAFSYSGPKHPSLSAFYSSLPSLIQSLPLIHSFTLYHSGLQTNSEGKIDWPILPWATITQLRSLPPKLEKFEIHGILVAVNMLEWLVTGTILNKCKNLVMHLGWEKEKGLVNLIRFDWEEWI